MHAIEKFPTGIADLDVVLGGGLPEGGITILAGAPGAGKTILAQEIAFHRGTQERPALCFNTLSEPSAKTLRYCAQFEFFDRDKVTRGVDFVDLGLQLRTKGIAAAAESLMENVKRVRPGFVVVDSFKVFDEMASSREELRRFGYELAVQLMAWQATALLLGEYTLSELAKDPLFSIVDGLITMAQRDTVAGGAGTGKTVALLEFIYRGAIAGDKGLFFSFEETPDRLETAAAGFGWDLAGLREKGLVEIVFVPEPEISVERDLETLREVIAEGGAAEAVVDGVILLTSQEYGLERERYIEIYKLRHTAHLKGRHSIVIRDDGVRVFPRYSLLPKSPRVATSVEDVVPTGVPGLDALLGGGLRAGSSTLLSGSTGIEKTTVGLQFLTASAARGRPGIFVALAEAWPEILVAAKRISGTVERSGFLDVLTIDWDFGRPNQLLSTIVERVQKRRATSLVLDSIGDVIRGDPGSGALHEIVVAIVGHLRELGVTSLFTLGAPGLFDMSTVSEIHVSAAVDNVMMMRYVRSPGAIRPTLTAVKTRGTPHSFGTHYVDLRADGARIAEAVG